MLLTNFNLYLIFFGIFHNSTKYEKIIFISIFFFP